MFTTPDHRKPELDERKINMKEERTNKRNLRNLHMPSSELDLTVLVSCWQNTQE